MLGRCEDLGEAADGFPQRRVSGRFAPSRRATMKVDGQNPECGICQLNRSMSEAGEIIWENKHW